MNDETEAQTPMQETSDISNDKTSETSGPRIALVTGANRGIGLAIVKGLLAQGDIVIAGCRQPQAAKELAALTEAYPAQLNVVALDVCEDDSVARLAAKIETEYARLDVLVNNAGIARDHWQPGLSLDIELMRETMETNLYGVLRCCQAFLPLMQRNGYGRVVNLSSELASMGEMQMGSTVAYRTSKAALNALTKLLALELAEHEDILVNAACPGWVKTELGGADAPLSTEEGADTPLWLANLPKGSGSGGLYRERAPYPW